MAVEFLACNIRPTNLDFADQISELWSEFEEGKTPSAILVNQVDELERIQQAVMYEERTGKDMSEFMSLKENITLPQLQPLLATCLENYEELKRRKQANITVVFVSGGPGIGKGTQCALLAPEFDFHHISVGDLLREEAKNEESPFREFIPRSIQRSIIIPPRLTTLLLQEEMNEAQAAGKTRFLLDGFPRSIEQADEFGIKICNRYSTLSFDCSEVELRQRLDNRSRSSGRIDDNPDSILRRLATFNENNAPVLKYLEEHGPVYKVDCTGSIEDVHGHIRPILNGILQNSK